MPTANPRPRRAGPDQPSRTKSKPPTKDRDSQSRGRGRGQGKPTGRVLNQVTRHLNSNGNTSKTIQRSSPKPRSQTTSGSAHFTTAQYGTDWNRRYDELKKHREQERVQAIKNGFLADPDKPRRLADAITPVGTCPDMCPEFERVDRARADEVWSIEKNPEKTAPDEMRMVKKFRRAAAGIDEQLPSDLRPPRVLDTTMDYLAHDIVDKALSLGDVHHFLWDRTRAIRTDFSIQQVTKEEDLRLAIKTYERIARFHILALNAFSGRDGKPYPEYSHQRDREQLDKTLLSLMQYYDDARNKLRSHNKSAKLGKRCANGHKLLRKELQPPRE